MGQGWLFSINLRMTSQIHWALGLECFHKGLNSGGAYLR